MKNYEGLTSHGNIEGRKIVLDIIEAGLRAADPYPNIRKMVRIEDGKLVVGHESYAVRDTVNAELPLLFDLSQVGMYTCLVGERLFRGWLKPLKTASEIWLRMDK